MIDVVTRSAREGSFKPGRDVQYMEYQRAAVAGDRSVVKSNSKDDFSLLCIVNPNNPTGI